MDIKKQKTSKARFRCFYKVKVIEHLILLGNGFPSEKALSFS